MFPGDPNGGGAGGGSMIAQLHETLRRLNMRRRG
jgi:aryl-alcohol dehydrogenase (NADP+)